MLPLLTGDVGVVVVQALLENGVGYVVSSWRERPTPIDAAVDDARERVLSPHGVVIRRLQSLRALQPIIAAPRGGITGEPPRGAVVFAGRRGMRPALERFLAVPCSGSVVGFTFDEDAARIEDAIVVDPEPTAVGIVRAIDEALLASRCAGRPAVVLLRERALGMRGTIRRRPARAPRDAARADAAWRAAHPLMNVPASIEQAGLVRALAGRSTDGPPRLLVVAGPLLQAAERALAQLAASPGPGEVADAAAGVSIVSTRSVGVLPMAGSVSRALVDDAGSILVVGTGAERLAARLRGVVSGARVEARACEPGTMRGERLVELLGDWLANADGEGAAVEVAPAAHVVARRSTRVPRRNEALYRGIEPATAAGLALAQGVVGVPARVDAAHPTYRTDAGVALTVVASTIFAAHGLASAAPGHGTGVFVVTGSGGDVAAAAGRAGATLEHVDGSDPRAIAKAIARSCASPRVSPHVICVAQARRLPAARRARFGMDPDLVGTDRLALAAVPAAATAMASLDDELLAGPSLIALDVPDTHAALQPLRSLTAATWDLSTSAAPATRHGRAAWNLRRRIIRAATGVDL